MPGMFGEAAAHVIFSLRSDRGQRFRIGRVNTMVIIKIKLSSARSRHLFNYCWDLTAVI